ncbi:MAG: 3' terminal RNA ribose 2'-O-methyltransferase Hen1 [Pyrinomonadaceae bacterium MAG19_C2-C3]|nr:3' terminal RNA ribose 2'-O-methyltransferase Hen1 [Pyrinomonadaceae bacterium MAG19_C2-C3]
MLLTITTTHAPATDLGYLLHKNPARVQSFDLSFGAAHVFYEEANTEVCTAALLLDVDVVGLVRNRRTPHGEGGTLQQYVNDRPYVASSFLSVALSRVFRSAMNGICKERAELVEEALPLEARLAVVPCRGGEGLLRRLFEPLGYEVEAVRHELDEEFSEWGESSYFTVALRGRVRLRDLLTHLYVLIPVLDNEKHYWVGDDEVEKLLRHGAEWLSGHPARDEIARRYLKHRSSLAREAVARLIEEDDVSSETAEVQAAKIDEKEPEVERAVGLHTQRLNAVLAVLKSVDAKRVVDLGCGEGKLLRLLLADKSFTGIVGMDVSHRSLEIAHERLNLERLPERQQERIKLLHGSLMYRDRRLEGFDAACVVEVIEHLDAPRLVAFERVLFEFVRPDTIVLTTPNSEYNVRFETLPEGKLRHKDHRFEWTRDEFETWANGASNRFGYTARFLPIGDEDSEVGAPSQMGVFTLKDEVGRMKAEVR